MSENLSKKFSQIYEFKEDNQYFNKILSFSPIVISPLRKNIEELMALFPQWKSFNYISFFVDKLLIETIKQVLIFSISIFIKNGLDKFGLILVEKFQSFNYNKNTNQLLLSKSLSTENINGKLNSIPIEICHSHLIAFFSKNRCQIVRAYVMKMPFPEMVFQKCNDKTNEFLVDRKKLVTAIQKYDPNHEKKANINTYLSGYFRIILINSFNLKSDWNLLLNVPQKDANPRAYRNRKNFLFQALKNKYGATEKNDIYIYLWELLIPIYQAERIKNTDNKYQKWDEPILTIFEKVAEIFNLEIKVKKDIPDVIKNSSNLTAKDVKIIMLKCIEVLRIVEKTEQKQTVSYEEIKEKNENFNDFIPAKNTDLWTNLLNEESRNQYNKLLYEIAWIEKIVLPKIRSKIPQKMREVVMMMGYKYLKFKTLTQQELAQEILGNQKAHTTIGRFFQRFEQIFEEELFNICQIKVSEKETIGLLVSEYYTYKFKNILNLILSSDFSILLAKISPEKEEKLETNMNELNLTDKVQKFITYNYDFDCSKYSLNLEKTLNQLLENAD